MTAELLVNVTPRETRVALIENGVLQEIFVERANRRGLVGNIYKGRVRRVLPGMQAAFVDIGLERAAFLHASDAVPPKPPAATCDPSPVNPHGRSPVPAGEPGEREARVASQPGGRAGGDSTNGARPPVPDVTELLREGQEVLVQVIRDPIGGKGARLTTHISIPSCYLVHMPGASNCGVSQRIEDEAERARLRNLVRTLGEEHRARRGATAGTGAGSNDHPGADGPGQGGARSNGSGTAPRPPRPMTGPGDGYIVRTAAEAVSDELLVADMEFLHKLWESVQDASVHVSAPGIVHEDLPLVIRTLRELTGTEIERARIDSRETVKRVLDFTRSFIPEMAARIEHYAGERPIFDLYGVEDEIQKALARRVQLKSGGHLVIDQTEAMTTIDVNTGTYVGHRNLEETIFKTNLEASQAIARQLRLRNLGGIIIIDFIDMTSEEHKRQVLRALEKSLGRDHTRTHISDVSQLGLVQMTRKRTRESLEHVLCEPCPTCSARGMIKTPDTVCYEIFREILREARQYDADRLLVIASQEVVDRIVDDESASFAELEAFVGKPITLQVEALYPREQYDVVLM